MKCCKYFVVFLITFFPWSSSFGDPETVFSESDHGFLVKEISDNKKNNPNSTNIQNEDFDEKVNTLLPQFLPYFQKAAQIHKLPWQLLAAVAYEESAWVPDAKSATGVIGFMQITSETAQFLGIKNRLDVKENIFAGAKYLRLLLNKFPKSLSMQDRLSLTLAAWNIGIGHIEDAKKLARERKVNPHLWKSIKKILPLLADEEVSKNLRFGKARGLEPVQFVSRVMQYYQWLLAVNLTST